MYNDIITANAAVTAQNVPEDAADLVVGTVEGPGVFVAVFVVDGLLVLLGSGVVVTAP
jgi:hypothetical protein